MKSKKKNGTSTDDPIGILKKKELHVRRIARGKAVKRRAVKSVGSYQCPRTMSLATRRVLQNDEVLYFEKPYVKYRRRGAKKTLKEQTGRRYRGGHRLGNVGVKSKFNKRVYDIWNVD